ncbi:MAG: type secretion system protein [Pedosphaera sp.]|nr:type secretion system protein [Pedosphaera sp.]
MKLKQTSKKGFTLIEIMIVVAIIGLLAAIAIPNFVHARNTAQMNACINNLRQVDGAKQQWALENKSASTATPLSGDIQPYMGRGSNGSLPVCPLDSGNAFSSSYVIQPLGTAPSCNIQPTGTNAHVLN